MKSVVLLRPLRASILVQTLVFGQTAVGRQVQIRMVLSQVKVNGTKFLFEFNWVFRSLVMRVPVNGHSMRDYIQNKPMNC